MQHSSFLSRIWTLLQGFGLVLHQQLTLVFPERRKAHAPTLLTTKVSRGGTELSQMQHSMLHDFLSQVACI